MGSGSSIQARSAFLDRTGLWTVHSIVCPLQFTLPGSATHRAVPRNDWPIDHSSGRRSRRVSGFGSQHAGSGWLNGSAAHRSRIRHRVLRDTHRRITNQPGVCNHIAWHRSESAWPVCVGVVERQRAAIHSTGSRSIVMVVVVVRDVSDIGYARVKDVHIPEIAAAHAIPWEERFAKAQWAPPESAAKSEPE